jgi:thiol-disulfide isomerase/thioredoxin
MTRPTGSSEPENPTKEKSEAAQSGRGRRLVLIGAAALVGAAAGMAGVYGIEPFLRNAGVAPECRPAADMAKKLEPLMRGEVAALTAAASPIQPVALAFKDGEGAARTLGEWKGRTVLLNLWATWCVPCRKEMPALDALQKELGGPEFEVVAVNIDTRDPAKPKAWLEETGISTLAYYADPSAKIFQDLKAAGRAFGMPTTLLIDENGCEIASLAGPAEWASDDALKLIKAALGR